MTGAIVVFASIQIRPLFNPEDGGPGVKYALVVRIARAYDDQTQIVIPSNSYSSGPDAPLHAGLLLSAGRVVCNILILGFPPLGVR